MSINTDLYLARGEEKEMQHAAVNIIELVTQLN